MTISKTKWVNIKNKIKYGANWYGKKGMRVKFVKILMEKQKGLCVECKEKILHGEETVDHIIPVSLNGKHELENMQLLHKGCHYKKDKEHSDKLGALGGALKPERGSYDYKPNTIKEIYEHYKK